ncbi:hypothetical protein AAGV33_02850 [Flavobacterium sp. FBOR7N2.3]|uniref:Uncharacterized protein n=1 Tax=Flavobacterium magnesitis TaxID=3138077 RepID=A0ABV4TGV0_9FLAO
MKKEQFPSKTTIDSFSKKLSNKIRAGFKITEYNDKLPYVVLIKEQKNINHALHLQLFCITIGLWSIVWIYLTLTHIPKKEILIAIDEDGNIFEEKCLLT